MTKIIFFGAIFSSLILLNSCDDQPDITEKSVVIATLSANAEDTLIDKASRFEGEAHGGKFVYRTDSAVEYAVPFIYELNDSLINSDLRVIVNFWARAKTPLKGDGFAMSFQDKENIILWSNFDPIVYGAKPNEWINVIDSINITGNMVSKSGLLFRCFAYNPNKKTIMDFDDVSITIKKTVKITE